MRALIATGTGRYADPWHPYAKTSPLIADVLTEAGFHADIDHDVDHAMTRLEGVDLLVVNAGDPWRSETTEPLEPAALAGFRTGLERGIGVIAVHAALSSLRDYPDWPVAIGGMWVPGLSWHPPLDTVHVTGGALPDGTAIASFDVVDERYSRLQAFGERMVVAEHETEGERMPTAWVREHGAARVGVDALGHDERSWASDGHRALFARMADWVTRRG
ncbi:ThuA domain-containing protein [Microbacterium oryzae]|uniref:ThuA domain-containing protein n=1 Tax=Microbacterium oryzae TaxID=743009 RepID=UPI0025B1DC8D|nr:ThuA domain-containing protein [Microbacterium oryzae]MDN3311326.1 ThuA domain-containing protein [Microbacterium oryzae]